MGNLIYHYFHHYNADTGNSVQCVTTELKLSSDLGAAGCDLCSYSSSTNDELIAPSAIKPLQLAWWLTTSSSLTEPPLPPLAPSCSCHPVYNSGANLQVNERSSFTLLSGHYQAPHSLWTTTHCYLGQIGSSLTHATPSTKL